MIKALVYIATLNVIQVPTNYVAYFYLVKFKAPGQPLPVSFLLKPLFTLITWIFFMVTSAGTVTRTYEPTKIKKSQLRIKYSS